MGGDNGDGNRDRTGKGRPLWAERDRERGKGGAGVSGAGNSDRR